MAYALEFAFITIVSSTSLSRRSTFRLAPSIIWLFLGLVSRITMNNYGDSVDGPVAEALAPPPDSPSCDGLVDLTAHSRRCFHLSSSHFEDRSSFSSVPPLSLAQLLLPPPPPPLSVSSTDASAGNLGEQIPVGRREETLESFEPQSGCDMEVPGNYPTTFMFFNPSRNPEHEFWEPQQVLPFYFFSPENGIIFILA